MRIKEIPLFLLAIVLPQIAGFIGAFFTVRAIPEWYALLVKPNLAPPNWVFAPVWTTLYLLMGAALFLVWRRVGSDVRARSAVVVFLIQLALNALWSFLFFGLRSPSLGFLGIAFLWVSIVLSMYFFARVSKASFWLLAPYLLWTTFAGYLNYMIWMLN